MSHALFLWYSKWQELQELIEAEKSGTCANKSKLDLQHLYVLDGG